MTKIVFKLNLGINYFQVKQSYTLDTKLEYLFGNAKIIDPAVPRSTKQYWRKSKTIKEFCSNNLCQSINDVEPAALIFENKKLQQQCSVLSFASAGLCKALLHNRLSVQQKKDIVAAIDTLKDLCSLQKACTCFNITTQLYYAWKNNNGCHQSVIKLCRKKFPNQLTNAEVALIKIYMEDSRFLQWSRVSVYWQLCRTEGSLFAKSTFYKYCKVLGYGRRTGLGKCKKNTAGIKAAAVGQIIHVDVTEVYAKNHEKAHVLFVQDNFSRKIIGFHAAAVNNSFLQAATIKKALENMGKIYSGTRVITDGGSENKGAVDVMLKQHFPGVQKIIAKVHVPFANNVVEALHHKIKHQIFPKEGFDCFNSIVHALPHLVETYNAMPHDSLHGGTPDEVFAGVFPDAARRFEQLKNAAVVRLSFNKGFSCCG